MIKLIYFDFNFWRIDIFDLVLVTLNIPYDYKRIPKTEWANKKNFPFGQLPIMIIGNKKYTIHHSLAKFCAIEANFMVKINLKVYYRSSFRLG